MHRETTFPRLREGVKLKRFDQFVLLYHFRFALHDLIDPSHALVLSLCSGAYSQREICYLFRETYGISEEEATETVASLLSYYEPFLELSDHLWPTAGQTPDPRDFVYKPLEASPDEHGEPPVPVPIGINLNLTLACNFRCRYCYQVVSVDGHGRLDLPKCLDLVDEAADWGVAYAGMTGGEPTLFPGWLNLLERILSHGMGPVFTTNGTVIGSRPELARRMREIGLREITVSLDAPTPELHHRITRSKGSFAKVVRAIRHLVEAGVRTTIKTVLTPLNAGAVGDLVDFVVDLGVAELGISYMEAGADGAPANREHRISPEQLARVREVVLGKRELYEARCAIHPPRAGECAWGESDWYPCGGLYTGMSIFPSGDVTICDKMGGLPEYSYGNVFDQGLREIWEGERFRELRRRTLDRERISADCAACSKLSVCRTGCPLDSYVASGDYLAKHPLCAGPF